MLKDSESTTTKLPFNSELNWGVHILDSETLDHTVREPGSSTHRSIYQPLPQASPLYQCELLSKILHKIGDIGVDIIWTTWGVNSLENFFLTEYFFFMNSRYLWSQPDLAHLLRCDPILVGIRMSPVRVDYPPPGQRDERWAWILPDEGGDFSEVPYPEG